MITDQMIIKETGQYDKEVIQRLRLEKLSIYKMNNLEGFTSLLELSLAHNEISIIVGLDSLTSLQRLNLSHNQIRVIENLSALESLEILDLRANSIEKTDDVSNLVGLEALRALHLSGTDGEDANPCCAHTDYINTVIRILPQLQIIDGGHVEIKEAFMSLDDQIDLLRPDPGASATPPSEPWFDQKDKEFACSTAEINGSEYVESSRLLAPALESFHKVADILNEECSHVLRKAQGTINKA